MADAPDRGARPAPGSTEEARAQRIARAFGHKVGLMTAAVVAVALAAALTVLFAIDAGYLIDALDVFGWIPGLEAWVEGNVRDLGDGARDLSALARLVLGGLLNASAFLVLLVLGWILGGAIATWATREDGEWSPYGQWCVDISRHRVSAGLVHLLTGLLVVTAGFFLLWHHWTLTLVLGAFPAVMGAGLWFFALGCATLVHMPRIVDPPKHLPERRARPPAPEPNRGDPAALLGELRRSPVYRRQAAGDRELGTADYVQDRDGGALRRLLDRYPRLSSVMPVTGVEALTAPQAEALWHVLDHLETRHAGADHEDFVFFGWPGSGRSTVASLLALGAVLHGEGAMYCLTAESARRSVDSSERLLGGDGAARHPSLAVQRWLREAGLGDRVVLRQAYDGEDQGLLRLDDVDMLFTDVRVFCKAVLARAGGAARDFLRRLRYVVIDHPERLAREDLIRLRISVARLRIVGRVLGASPTFLLIAPPLDNVDDLAKYLLAEANVPSFHFLPWFGEARVLGWLPPLEFIAELDGVRARAVLVDEVVSLLVEVGKGWSAQEGLHIAVVDALPVLGPETRRWIRSRIWDELGRRAPGEAQIGRITWDFFGTAHLAIDRRRSYDLVFVVGVGEHPDALLYSIRGALSDGGALVFIGTSSPADITSLEAMRQPDWPPRVSAKRGGPRVVIPDHSEDVVAHELALLFDELGDHPIPEEALYDALPGHVTPRLLAQWLAEGTIRRVPYFRAQPHEVLPRVERCLLKAATGPQPDRYHVPWGCSTRTFYEVKDVVAADRLPRNRQIADYVDHDRQFIDLFPGAHLRHSPQTVVVEHWRDYPDGARRTGAMGTVEVHGMPTTADVDVDRRRCRLDAELVSDVPHAQLASHLSERDLEACRRDPLGPLLRLPEGATPDFADGLLVSLRRPELARDVPGVRLATGLWRARVRERLRDRVATDTRLVEEPGFVTRDGYSALDQRQREYECVAINLFFERVSAELSPDATSYGAHHALARMLMARLRREYIDPESELRLMVVPTQAQEAGGPDPTTGFRLVLYRLRSNEFSVAFSVHREVFTEARRIQDALSWISDRLVDCDCDDGCAQCCGGLGTVPASRWTPALAPRYSEADIVSRRGAYELVCAVLGRAPDRERFARGARRRTALPTDELGPRTQAHLERLRAEVLGTEQGDHEDGEWFALFDDLMRVPASDLAEARWASEDEYDQPWAGWYRAGVNEVVVMPRGDDDSNKRTLLHEYVHNWQFRTDEFDLAYLRDSPEATRFFDGKLIIEGHAKWCDAQLRVSEGLGGAYEPDDGLEWTEYKTGYLLFDYVEREFGQRGVFAWVHPDGRSDDATRSRSRSDRLRWPFTITDALQAAGLLDEARAGKFEHVDLVEDDEDVEA